ncbi:uncharacterized protein METZ01_LOCUS376057, partial [marine metagenome]
MSTAYHLARRDFGRVLLLEKGRPGDGASSRAAGTITGLMWSNTGVEARKANFGRFRELSKVGLLAFSLDGEPILGRIDAVPGLFVGTAFHSGG